MVKRNRYNKLVLDVQDRNYFKEKGYSNQHGGGGTAVHEIEIMNGILTK